MPNPLIENLQATTQRIIESINSAITKTNFKGLNEVVEFDLALSRLQRVYRKASEQDIAVRNQMVDLSDEDKEKVNNKVPEHLSQLTQLQSDIIKIKEAFIDALRIFSFLDKEQTLDFDSINEEKIKAIAATTEHDIALPHLIPDELHSMLKQLKSAATLTTKTHRATKIMEKEEKELSDHLDIISLTQDLKKHLYNEYRDTSDLASIAEALIEHPKNNPLPPKHNPLPPKPKLSPPRILSLAKNILSKNKSFTPEEKEKNKRILFSHSINLLSYKHHGEKKPLFNHIQKMESDSLFDFITTQLSQINDETRSLENTPELISIKKVFKQVQRLQQNLQNYSEYFEPDFQINHKTYSLNGEEKTVESHLESILKKLKSFLAQHWLLEIDKAIQTIQSEGASDKNIKDLDAIIQRAKSHFVSSTLDFDVTLNDKTLADYTQLCEKIKGSPRDSHLSRSQHAMFRHSEHGGEAKDKKFHKGSDSATPEEGDKPKPN